MKNLLGIIMAVAVVAAVFGLYMKFLYKSPAYKTYLEFEVALSENRYGDATAMCSGEIAKNWVNWRNMMYRNPELSVPKSGVVVLEHTLISEEKESEDSVRLVVIEKMRAKKRSRSWLNRHEVLMIRDGDEWMVEEFKSEPEL